ncbi:UDP-N-acetylmuramate--L-alanine ligase, partial [bacterium]|nr:UDP-N-acetylmuramate--L-alanine ligase [candidate division CSSED10-310 bacterium]
RRLDVKGEINNVLILDDYAHHPTEIKATLDAVEQAWKRPVTAIFQPHRYSRTKALADAFAKELSRVNRLIIMPVYAASETPIPGVDAQMLADKCRMLGAQNITVMESADTIADYLGKILVPGDIAISLGAGDVFKVTDILVDRLKPDQENL